MVNRRTKTAIVSVALVMLLAMMLAACSKSSGGGGNDTTAQAESKHLAPIGTGQLKYDPNATVNDGKKITIKFWTIPNFLPVYTKWTEEYSKIHPNVKFDIVNVPGDSYWTKIGVALKGGTGPDIFFMHNSQNFLLPNIEPYPEAILPRDALKSDFRQIDEHVFNDKIYYIDAGIMTAGIFYNKKMFKEAGLTDQDIPQTWEKFREVAKKLTVVNDAGQMTRAGFNYNTYYQYLLGAMNAQSGIWFFGPDGKSANLDHPEVIENANFLLDLYNKDKVGSPLLGPEMSESFGSGKAAMVYSWGWLGAFLQNNFPDLEYGFFPTPHFEGKDPIAYDRNNGESTPSVSAKADEKHKAVAFDFIKYFLANDEALLDFCVLDSIAPSKYSLDGNQRIKDNIALKGQADIMDRTFWPGAVPDIYFQDLTKYLAEDVLLNHVPLQNAIKNATNQINKDMATQDFKSTERLYKYAGEMKQGQ